jgi:hypothetical protein
MQSSIRCRHPRPIPILLRLNAKLQGMRAELARLNAVTIPADDIAGKAKAYVDELKTRAAPMLRGIGNGQDLDVRWSDGSLDANSRNGSGYSSTDGNALLLFALLMPKALMMPSCSRPTPCCQCQKINWKSVAPNCRTRSTY